MVVTLHEVRAVLAEGVPVGRGDDDSSRRQWWAALATLQDDILVRDRPDRGIWLAAPLPALYEASLLRHLQGWVWAPAAVEALMRPSAPLLPGSAVSDLLPLDRGFQRLALADDDGTDPLLVLITPKVQVALALDGAPDSRRLVVRFDPDRLSAALALLDRRLQHDDPTAAAELRRALHGLGPLRSDADLGMRFWPLLAQRLAEMAPSVTLQPLAQGRGAAENREQAVNNELALLEALTHEVRTPLATIRTLIRSLLRRQDLPAVVRQRLEQIDGECTEQIDRFGLIFLAAEQQRQPTNGKPLGASDLAQTDLGQLLRQMASLWHRQLERRGLRLELVMADDLPPVLSDPSRLETMLGGLMDRFSRSLPGGGTVRLSVQPAGARLKLQLSREAGQGGAATDAVAGRNTLVGPVLSWNPETGSLQLSRQATQRLFHRLGGRLTQRGDTSLTVFLPTC